MTGPAKPAAQVVEYATERMVDTDRGGGYIGDSSWINMQLSSYAQRGWTLHTLDTYVGSDRRNRITLLVFERPVEHPEPVTAGNLRVGTVFRWEGDPPNSAFTARRDGRILSLADQSEHTWTEVLAASPELRDRPVEILWKP